LIIPFLLAASLPAFAEVDSKIHKLCVEAKDYSGCVKSHGAINGSNTASSDSAQLRRKEMYDKLYNFNKRQFIAKNPSLAGWVQSNPKIARESIEKELLFFREGDYQLSKYLYLVCLSRGETIDINFEWRNVCTGINNKKSISANNILFHKAFIREQERQFAESVAKGKCTSKGKQLRYGFNGESMCMTDFEYASYEEQQRSRRATAAYRERMSKQADIDRKNAARRRSWEAVGDSLESLGEQINPKTINCTTTYGSYSSNTSCY